MCLLSEANLDGIFGMVPWRGSRSELDQFDSQFGVFQMRGNSNVHRHRDVFAPLSNDAPFTITTSCIGLRACTVSLDKTLMNGSFDKSGIETQVL